ncbi:Uncharacterized protein PBTT_03899 [Plasmodiophora brassicae]
MLFLQIGPSSDLYSTLATHAPGHNVTAFPDANVWEATFGSWYYQLFIRILPGAILIGSGCAAVSFFAAHMRIINEKYENAVPAERRSRLRWLAFVRRSAGLPHAVLAIEMVTATSCGIVLAVGGFQSTPDLPFPVVAYFMTLFGGWSFTSSLLAASTWIRHIMEHSESQSWLTRVLRGDYKVVSVLLIVVPVASDTAASAVWSTYRYSAALSATTSGILFLLQLTVGVHVLVIVLRYCYLVSDVQSQLVVPGREPRMDAFLKRLTRCALGMSLSMVLICVGTALASSVSFLNIPTGWTTCFALAYNGRALDTAFRVAMFRPRGSRFTAPTNQPQTVKNPTDPAN